MFGTAQVELVHRLRGHTRALQNVRMVSREVNPEALAVWTMPDFRDAFEDYLYRHYVKRAHPGLNGTSPETALSESVALSGERRHRRITYDDTFRVLTLPSLRRPAVKITPPGKIHVLHIDYWCPEFPRPRALGDVGEGLLRPRRPRPRRSLGQRAVAGVHVRAPPRLQGPQPA